MFARDLLWKLIYVVSIVVLILALATWLVQDLRQFQWQGPELTLSNPILLVMAFGDLWTEFAGLLAWSAFGVLCGAAGLWIIFEAYFRGGSEHFWLYVGSRVASITILGSATVLLAAVTLRSGEQTGVISSIVLLFLWGIVTLIETLVRRDAVQLIVTDRVAVLGAMGSFLGLHAFLASAAIATAGLGTTLMLRASRPAQFLAAAFLMAVALLLWTIVHSYLVVVRYSTIDLLRDNVAGI